MLCPEIWNFPSPKVITSCKHYEKLENAVDAVQMNNFYKSVIITCPDELFTPSFIEEILSVDTEFYRISGCPVTEFIAPLFIEKFVRNGKIYCLTADKNCMVHNCASITPDGIFTLNVLESIYQTLGLDGTKRSHSFYEVKLDLLNLTHVDKLKQGLSKLQGGDFYISWLPNQEDICPSSIAKYFHDKNISVSVHDLDLKKLNPTITEIPNPIDVELDEIVEWIGMLAIGGDLAPSEPYISTYSQPESDLSLHSTRISLLITKGFHTSTLVKNVCNAVSKYVTSRDLDNHWASVSVQSDENSLWQWNKSGPRMFQAQNSSCNIFFTKHKCLVYTVGQLKYS